MIRRSFLLALALTLVRINAEGGNSPLTPVGDAETRVPGNSVQTCVDVARAASYLKSSVLELPKKDIPTINVPEIEDIRPHRFTAIFAASKVIEHLALWVRTESKGGLSSDPFAPKLAAKEPKSRLFLVIMVRVKYSELESWNVNSYFGEHPGPLFEAAILELTGTQDPKTAADRFCREWSMLPDAPATPPVKRRSGPILDTQWLANLLFVNDP